MSWSDYIRDDLRTKIRGADALPERFTLHGLSRQYGVSITPVRAAVDALVAEKMLVRRDNGRLAVNPKKLGSRPAGQSPAPPRDHYEEISRDLIGQSLQGVPIFVREEQTAEHYGISTAAVREVFHRLAGTGVLEHLPRRGWQLRPFRRKDLDNYLEVREVLELTALDQAWPHLIDTELRAIRDGNRLPADQGQPPVIDDSLHGYIVEKADNVYIRDFFQRHGRYYRILFDWDAIQSDRDAAIEAVQQHHEILAAMLGRDRRAAKKALAHHIRTNYGRLNRLDPSTPAAKGMNGD